MSQLKDGGFFVQKFDEKFGTYSLDAEYPRKETQIEKPHYSLTETQYFGFFVPEERIQCFMWTWYHPNMNVVSGGVMGWQGFKKFNVGCEILDYRAFMNGELVEDFTNYTLDSGITLAMTKPGQQFRLTYDDPEHGNSFDVIQDAVSEPLMWPSNHHFEQIMRCSGTITMRGKTHEVKCFSVRDRSYGEYRKELSIAIPPNNWMAATFDENNAFCVVGLDDPKREPLWKGRFDIAPDALLRFGWMVIDGERVVITRVSMKTDFDSELLPRRITLRVTDSNGREHDLVGEAYASLPFAPWPNARMPICAMRWTWNGRVGLGEFQSLQYNDFARLHGSYT